MFKGLKETLFLPHCDTHSNYLSCILASRQLVLDFSSLLSVPELLSYYVLPVHDGGPGPHSVSLWLVLLGGGGRELPSGLHKQQQPVLLQPAAAGHHPRLRLLPPLELDGDQAVPPQLGHC